MRHWINSELGAVNVMTVPVDPTIPERFAELASAPLDDKRFTCVSPPWNSDVRWISAVTEDAFEMFQKAFDDLGFADAVAPYIDIDKKVRMYAGFLVIRSVCTAPSFHVDWIDTNNEGFNMLTPISSNAAGFGLLYKKLNGKTAEYDYKRGEALIIGDHFSHSTAPGRSEEPVALLSFTFGTDKMEHWDKLFRTAGYQSVLLRRPDGQFHRNPDANFNRA